jgi:hypothetical protein
MNKDFKNAPEGTTHRLNGKFYKVDKDVELSDIKGIYVKEFTVSGYWHSKLLTVSDYLEMQPKENNLWYDFEEEKAFTFPTRKDKFLYDGSEACMIGVSADGIFPVLDCTMGLRKLTLDDLQDITPIETPEVTARLGHTLKSQASEMKKFLKGYDKKINIDKASLVRMYDEGWRINKNQ